MNKKIVLWGNDAEDKKILVGIALNEEENKVKIYTYDELTATQEVYDHMMNKWRTDDQVDLAPGYQVQDRPLSVTDDLLPEDIKVERTDLISRAKAEWHFIVLSSKLYQMYSSELEDFKDKIDNLGEYSESVWEEMKGFWGKVQEQVREKNLFREHASDLRGKTNELFDKLKDLKKSFQSEFKKKSAETAAKYKDELAEIEEKIEKGLGLKPIFDQLKGLQARFKKEKFTKDDQRKLWNRIDKAFKVTKEKRFGDQGQSGGALSRIQRRYDGLLGAIQRMERSIGRDNKDLEWENKRIERTDGQLEMQIRQAKIKMINERISSKQEKLDDMIKTKAQLEQKIEQEKKREEARAQKAKAKEAQKEIKEKIAAEMKEAQEARAEEAEKLENLAAKIVDHKKGAKATAKNAAQEVESKAKAVTENVAKKAEETAEQVEKVADKAADQVEKAVQEVKEEADKLKETAKDKAQDLKQAAQKAEQQVEDKASTIADTVDDAADKAKAEYQSAKDKASDLLDDASDAARDTAAAAKEMMSEAGEDVQSALGNAIDTVKAMAEVAEDKIEDRVDEVKQKIDQLADDPEVKEIKDQVTNVIGGAIAAIKDLTDKVEDKVEDIVDDLLGEEE